MKSLLIFLTCLSTFTAAAFDQNLVHKAAYNPKQLSVSNSKSWKFTVQFYTNNSTCTGFFITTTKMLSAAHCFEANDRIDQILFYTGSEYSHYTYPTTHKIRRHPTRDIAVIDFEQPPARDAGFYELNPATTVSRRHLLYFSELRNKNLYVIGAGINNKRNRNYLGFIKGRFYGEYGSQVRYKSGRQGTCGGDSGGPVTISDPRDGLVVVGITVSTYMNINKNCGNDSYFEVLDSEASDWIWK
jgi:V8-like Glu-specific endopeptidase